MIRTYILIWLLLASLLPMAVFAQDAESPEEHRSWKVNDYRYVPGSDQDDPVINAMQQRGIRVIAMERIPRISRAQSMDALSSQSNIAGYRAVIEAASHFGRFLPLMMTSAGSSKPARVVVLGVGVAGLQAIATARRMGAIVSATDVRPATKEQVQSLGAKFIAVEDEEFKQAQTAAGYAKPMSPEYQANPVEAITAAELAMSALASLLATIRGCSASRAKVSGWIGVPVRPGMS